MSDALRIERFNDYAVVVGYDPCPSSPREWDNLGKLWLQSRSVSLKECDEKELGKARIKIPVYKYEHSGVVLKASEDGNPFTCPWDSCRIGTVAVSAETLRKEYSVKRVTRKIVEKAKKVLVDEVNTFSQYLEGDVYCFKVYKVDHDVPDAEVEDEGELIDSCYGFYSVEDAMEDGKAWLPDEALQWTPED